MCFCSLQPLGRSENSWPVVLCGVGRTPARMFPQQVCLLRPSPSWPPILSDISLSPSQSLISIWRHILLLGVFCHVVKIHTSRWLEHGTWPGCFVNLEMVCTIFPLDTRTSVSCCVLCQVMWQKGALTCQPLWCQDPCRADMMSLLPVH